MNMNDLPEPETVARVVVFIICVALVVTMPLALIWSINTLFGLMIPYTLLTWSAAFFIALIFSPSAVGRKT